MEGDMVVKEVFGEELINHSESPKELLSYEVEDVLQLVERAENVLEKRKNQQECNQEYNSLLNSYLLLHRHLELFCKQEIALAKYRVEENALGKKTVSTVMDTERYIRFFARILRLFGAGRGKLLRTYAYDLGVAVTERLEKDNRYNQAAHAKQRLEVIFHNLNLYFEEGTAQHEDDFFLHIRMLQDYLKNSSW
jgi:hypothetical protein